MLVCTSVNFYNMVSSVMPKWRSIEEEVRSIRQLYLCEEDNYMNMYIGFIKYTRIKLHSMVMEKV